MDPAANNKNASSHADNHAEEVAAEPSAAGSDVLLELKALREQFESRFRYDESKERAFQKLYVELDELKRNAAEEALRPMYLDIILFLDRIDRLKKDFLRNQPSYSDIVKMLETLMKELDEILARRGVERIQVPTGDYDGSCQRVVGLIRVDKAQAENCVIETIREGYVCNGSVLRPADVIVSSYSTTEEG